MTIIQERLALLDSIHLDGGAHSGPDDGLCFNEAAAWLAGEPHSSRPRCVSPVLRAYTMRLNDRWSDDDRQLLKPYLIRYIGTAGDGKDPARLQIAQRALVEDLLPPWLRLAGLDADADKIASMAEASRSDVRRAVYAARDHALEKRRDWRARIKAKVREHMKGVAAAAAAAAAAADSVADVVADVVAVAAADADVVAVADAVAVAAADPWGAGYAAARRFWAQWIAENDATKQIRDLAAQQRQRALTLLDQMIDPDVTA